MSNEFITIAGIAALSFIKKGSKNQGKEFSVVRVEKRKAGWSGREMMRSVQRTGMPPHMSHNPNKIVGLSITIEGKDPESLKRYQQGGEFAKSIARKNGLYSPLITFRNVYPSRTKANCWNAIWDAR